MGKVRGHIEETVVAQRRPGAPDVVTAGAPLGEGDVGSVPSVRERLRSRDLAVKVFVAGATYVALVWINKAWAVIGAVLSPIVSDLVRDFVERHDWSLRRLRRGSAATVLLGHEEAAYASEKRAGRRRPGGRIPGGFMASASAVALVGVGIAAVSLLLPGGGSHAGTTGPPPTLARVAGVQGVSPTATAPTIAWPAVPGATSYAIYRNGGRIAVRAGLRYVDAHVKHGTYTYQVAAIANGSEGPPSAGRTIVYQGTVPPNSTTHLYISGPTASPPSDATQSAGVPTGLHAVGPIVEAPRLEWNAIAGADHYVVYRDGNPVATAPGPEYRDSTVDRGTYAYAVSAVVAHAEGGRSESVVVQYALAAPVLSTLANPTNHPPRFSWTDVPGAETYVVYRDGQEVTRTTNRGFADPTRLADGSYTYEVAGLDSKGNTGSHGTLTVVYDTTPPSTPTGFGSAGSDSSQPPSMTWYAMPGVTYLLGRGDGAVFRVDGGSYTDISAPVGKLSVYELRAVDDAGNQSKPAGPVEILYAG
jgi:hypothetical protein